MSKTIVVDGVGLEMTDTTAQVVQRAIEKYDQSAEEMKKKMASCSEEADASKKKNDEAVALIATKDAEIATLKTQLKDAELTPAKLDAAVTERAIIIDKAKTILGDKLVVKDQSVHDIRKQVVDARLGDTAKAWTEDQVRVSFDTLAVDVKAKSVQGVTDIAHAFSAPSQQAQDNARSAYDEMCKDLGNAWQKKSGAAVN